MTLRKLTTLTALSTALMLAQPPAGGPPRTPPDPAKVAKRIVAHLADELNLTDSQQTQATKIFQDAATAEQPLQASLKTAHDSLAAAIKTNNGTTSNTIHSLALQIGTLTGQMVALQSTAQSQFYAILTPDQQTKFADLPGGGLGGFGMRGFGPPLGGPGPGPDGRRPRRQQQ